MNKRAVSLGGIVFDYRLHYKEINSPEDIDAEVATSESGIHLVWEREIQTPYITLESLSNGWIRQNTKDALMAIRSQIGATFTLVFDDSSTETVRFAHERNNGIIFTPHHDGCTDYNVQIFLAKVIL